WSVLDTSFASINQNGLLQAKKNGVVEVKALAKDGSGVFATKNINIQRVPLGTESKISEKFEVNIFPNPSNRIFQFEDKKHQAKQIQIWDLKGQLLQSIHSDEYLTEVDLSDLNSGIYLVAIVIGQEKVFRRVVLTK
ncbi:MAG: T9SS type A sorting domain-containing protein, partial [Bacteroidia bacterium]